MCTLFNVCQHHIQRNQSKSATAGTATLTDGIGNLHRSSTEWDSAKPFREIPGPKPLPLIGNVWRFLPFIGDLRNLNHKNMLVELSRRYGPILSFAVYPGKRPLVLIEDPEEIQNVFRNEGIWPEREVADSMTYYFREYCSGKRHSLLSEQGKAWQDFRSAVNSVMMNPKTVFQHLNPTAELSNEFIDKIRKMRDHKNQLPGNFGDEITKWSFESVSLIFLNTRLGALQEDLGEDSDASRMLRCGETIFECGYALDYSMSPWRYVTTPMLRKLVTTLDEFTELASKYVNKAIDELKSTSKEEMEGGAKSVLQRLFIESGSPQKTVDMTIDMMLAGTDSTSTMVSYVMYNLATKPEKQRLLQEELDRVIPDPRAPFTVDMFKELKYMRACIKETFRFDPMILANTRTTTKDIVISGYQVPKGTKVTMHHAALARSSRYVPRPLEFLPERWLPGGEDLRPNHPFVMLPFGFGPRSCIGKRFAQLKMEVFLSLLFRQCTVEWHHPPPKQGKRLALKYDSPLKFTVTERT